MTRFPIVDVYFTNAGATPKLVWRIDGLSEDEINVVVEALTRRFSASKPNTLDFTIKRRDDYSTLGWIKRERGGHLADCGIEDPFERFSVSLGRNPKRELSNEQQQWLEVRSAAKALCGEIDRLRIDLRRGGPNRASVAEQLGPKILLDHLDGVDCSPTPLKTLLVNPGSEPGSASKQMATRAGETAPSASDPPKASATDMTPPGPVPVADLMKVLRIPPEKKAAVEKRLKRLRDSNPLDDALFIESQDRAKNKPHFFYYLDRVKPQLKDLISGT